MHNGELIRRAVDLAIPGRGFKWSMDRTYRSGLNFDGPLGHNWEFSYNRRLSVQTNGDILRMDGYGRSDRYARTADGFLAPAGFFTQLTQNNDGTYLERDRHGGKAYYSVTNGQGMASLTALGDRNGNRMQFEYNSLGQLGRGYRHPGTGRDLHLRSGHLASPSSAGLRGTDDSLSLRSSWRPGGCDQPGRYRHSQRQRFPRRKDLPIHVFFRLRGPSAEP